MKNQLIMFSVAFLCLTTFPIGILNTGGSASQPAGAYISGTKESNGLNVSAEAKDENADKKEEKEKSEKAEKGEDDGSITVFLSEKKSTVSVSYFEYTCGSTAAEMPLSFEKEAIKAQAVACFTNAVRLKGSNNGNSTLLGADISDDTGTHQGYLSEKERRERWGDSFDEYEKKLEAAVNEVLNEVITYKGELCTAAFCAISPGTTESAQNVWGGKVPYLVSVKSSGDTLSPDYSTTSRYSRDEACEALKKLSVTPKEGEDLGKLIKIEKTSRAGTVLSATVGDKELSGEEIRTAFNLKSAAFTVKASENAITFTTVGYGHGVGLSQYGANYMAKNGSDYEDILKHYYKGVQISKL